jgi:NAD(P)-dependent dehydrogenase (short-subunit alcohol dehydrogenase family)
LACDRERIPVLWATLLVSSGALALRSDVTDATGVTRALEQVADARDQVDLVVNAAAAYGGERSGPFGGGAIAEARPDAFDSWAVAPARSAFTFLSATGRFLRSQGRPATVVQVTGGSARRAMAGRGLWAAGSFGVRAITNAAALELREEGHPGHPADRRRGHRAGKRALPGHTA